MDKARSNILIRELENAIDWDDFQARKRALGFKLEDEVDGKTVYLEKIAYDDEGRKLSFTSDLQKAFRYIFENKDDREIFIVLAISWLGDVRHLDLAHFEVIEIPNIELTGIGVETGTKQTLDVKVSFKDEK